MKAPVTLRFLAALAMLFAPQSEASPEFVAMLPNGDNVPDTPAIGHSDGTGDSSATNAFGDAFSEAGKKWTVELCMADTDGDGQTNGQELGDPCCEWDMDSNAVVQWTDGVSHPDDASKTSDESLWANITCGFASGSVSETSVATEDGNSTASSTTGSTIVGPTSSSQSSTSSAPTPTRSLVIAIAGVFTVAIMNFA